MKRVEIDENDSGSRRGKYRRHKEPDLTFSKIKAAVTNDNAAIVADVDQRGPFVRRFRDIVREHEVDLGGADRMSEGQKAIVRRLAMCQLLCEWLENKFIQRLEEHGEMYGANRIDQYRGFTETQRRLIESLGLSRGRTPRDVTPDDYTQKIIDGIQRGSW